MNTPQEDYALSLDLMSADEISVGLSPSVLATMNGSDIVVFRVPDDASDTTACSERYGIDLQDCANTIVMRYEGRRRTVRGDRHARLAPARCKRRG